jgi:ADP-ribose pyrophosphatase
MRQTGRRRVHNGWVKVDRLTLEDDGVPPSEWEVVVSADSVAVLAQLESGEFVLFRQYRVGPDRVLDELPGGGLEPGEDPVDGARRELREETGVVGGTARHLGSEWSAANETRRKHLVLITGATATGEVSWDEHERGTIVRVSEAELRDLVLSGELTDAGLAARGVLALMRDRGDLPPWLPS